MIYTHQKSERNSQQLFKMSAFNFNTNVAASDEWLVSSLNGFNWNTLQQVLQATPQLSKIARTRRWVESVANVSPQPKVIEGQVRRSWRPFDASSTSDPSSTQLLIQVFANDWCVMRRSAILLEEKILVSPLIEMRHYVGGQYVLVTLSIHRSFCDMENDSRFRRHHDWPTHDIWWPHWLDR